MATTLQVGGLPRGSFLVERLPLPVEELPALALARDAIDQAAAERKAVAILARKGMGKTVAIQRVLREFADYEASLKTEDSGYRERHAFLIQSPRSNDPLEVFSAIWKAVLGAPPQIRRRGRSISADDLRDELIEQLLAASVAVLVFDEAEKLKPAGLEAIRDVISVSESTAQARYDGDTYVPVGVGAVLLGDTTLGPTLEEWEETGHRLLRTIRLDGLRTEEVAQLYLSFLPGVQDHVDGIGREAWEEWIRQEVTHGKPTPVRLVENHTRAYVRRMAENFEEITSLEDVGFHEEVFLFTLSEIPLASASGSGKTKH